MKQFRFSMKDHMDAAAAICGIEGWQGYRWTICDGGGAIVKGCVPSGTYTRGPRKGSPKFRPAAPNTERTVIVADLHMVKVAAEYETTGKCWDCKGSGQTFAGWSAAEGVRHRQCTRCNGTGKSDLLVGGCDE